MPLTPEDVQKKTFTPVRLREGYDMGEVDQFLDEVEAELTSLHSEIDELRARLDDPTAAAVPVPGAVSQDDDAKGSAVPTETAPQLVVRTVPEASAAAARLLELATTSADQLEAEARQSADTLLASARSEAERLDAEITSRSEQMEAEARSRKEALDSETSQRREQLLSDLERDKDTLSQELEDLRGFEREYRTRLKAYFEAQLQALDGKLPAEAPAPVTPSTDESVPRRLRELLGDDA